MRKTSLLPEERIFKKIIIVRDQKILLDNDLAELYGVSTKVLKQAVRRNIDRFPEDFLFELTSKEWKNLRSQFVTSSLAEGQKSWGGQRYTPFAFTEQGVAMLSSVLNSSQAVAVNIQIMRVFVKMRHLITSYKGLLEKIEKLEASDSEKNKHIKNIYRTPLKTNNGTRITQIIMMIPIAIGNDFINENQLNQCYQRSICIPFVGFLEMPYSLIN